MTQKIERVILKKKNAMKNVFHVTANHLNVINLALRDLIQTDAIVSYQIQFAQKSVN